MSAGNACLYSTFSGVIFFHQTRKVQNKEIYFKREQQLAHSMKFSKLIQLLFEPIFQTVLFFSKCRLMQKKEGKLCSVTPQLALHSLQKMYWSGYFRCTVLYLSNSKFLWLHPSRSILYENRTTVYANLNCELQDLLLMIHPIPVINSAL